MLPTIILSLGNFFEFLPEIYLIIIVSLLLLFISFFILPIEPKNIKEELYFFFYDIIFCLSILIFFFFYLAYPEQISSKFLFHMAILIDYFSTSISLIILLLSILTFFLSFEFWKHSPIFLFEYPLLLMFAVLLLILLISSFNFISLYIILEGLSLVIYVLIVLSNVNYNSVISSLKYFCIGAIASGALLFGIVIFFAFFGSVNFLTIFWKIFFLSSIINFPFILYFSVFLICFGFLVKLGAFPGHFWVADVYNGCSASFLFFLLIVVKLVLILLFARILFFLFFYLFFIWYFILLFSGMGSIFFGALGALIQKKIKRFLAYTSINQVGFILLGFTGGSLNALYISFIYLFFYLCAIIIFFIVYLTVFLQFGRRLISLFDFNGLSTTSLIISIFLTISLFSMAGIPPLGGFIAKFWLLSLIFFSGHYFIGTFALLISVISSVYYLRILKCVWISFSTDKLALYFYHSNTFIIYLILFFLSSFLINWFFLSSTVFSFLLKLSCYCMCPLIF